jgi:hypothetical protein
MVTVNGAGGAHWVLIQCMRLRPPGDLGGGARACDRDLDLVGELLDFVSVVQELTTTPPTPARPPGTTMPVAAPLVH